MLLLDTFAELSYNSRLERGDMIKLGFVPDITTKIKVGMTVFDVTEIRKLRNELTTDEALQFR